MYSYSQQKCFTPVSFWSLEICSSYTNLSNPWRHQHLFSPKADSNLTKSWYRFTGISGDILYSHCHSSDRALFLCDAGYSGLLEGHVYTQKLCSRIDSYYGSRCDRIGETVEILLCPGGFYVYKLFPTDKTFITSKINNLLFFVIFNILMGWTFCHIISQVQTIHRDGWWTIFFLSQWNFTELKVPTVL